MIELSAVGLGVLVGIVGGLVFWFLTVGLRVVLCVIVGRMRDEYWLDTRLAEILFGLGPRHD